MQQSTKAYAERIEQLRQTSNLRTIPTEDTFISSGLIDLSSNDYLGLGGDVELQRQFLREADPSKAPLTSSAARLLAAPQRAYQELEQQLQSMYPGYRALLFNSGYHANTGLVSALASENGTLIIADKLVHASIIDGITLSRAPFRRFTHNSVESLQRILERYAAQYTRILVIVESIYSMDGDSAPLREIATLKHHYPNMILYVDEAHALGVYGPQGQGLCAETGLEVCQPDIIMGTFGKAIASSGAFAALSPTLHSYVINRARSFIFSTAIPPLCCAWTLKMLQLCAGMHSRRTHLKQLAKLLWQNLPEKYRTTPSHIQPITVGSSKKALEMSQTLLDNGFKVLAIRTPTVPPGTERLRVSLSAALTPQKILEFTQAIRSYEI